MHDTYMIQIPVLTEHRIFLLIQRIPCDMVTHMTYQTKGFIIFFFYRPSHPTVAYASRYYK